MIKTFHEKPQIKVAIDGMPAVCASLDCDFTYIQPTSEVVDMQIADLDVSITGTDLPDGLDLLSITIAKTDCEVQAISPTDASCTLGAPWVGGDWTPEIRDANGLAPLALNFEPYHVDIVVTSVSPNTELN